MAIIIVIIIVVGEGDVAIHKLAYYSIKLFDKFSQFFSQVLLNDFTADFV